MTEVIKDGVPTMVSCASVYVCILCGLVTLATVILCSVYGKKMAKMIPFIIGIVAGYLVATVFTLIGNATGNTALMVIDFNAFSNMKWIPDFTFQTAINGFAEITPEYIATIKTYLPLSAPNCWKNPVYTELYWATALVPSQVQSSADAPIPPTVNPLVVWQSPAMLL